ncbi:hypothetical protein TorRG33x02_162770 [Trema orientale]|uniref:DUF4218 domain-containing protein n=1 Tax=Trema orientale TaxID=63057 RepID=A0A2P5EQR4_TREOI|nr:hypothetical protein TorRG33x02_162770 [Trema orientale]
MLLCNVCWHQEFAFFVNRDISITIIELCNFFQLICARTLNMKDFEKSEVDITLILYKLERIFPLAFFDIMVHLMIHLPKEALLGGLVHYRWMYPYAILRSGKAM